MKCWERAKALDHDLARAVDTREEETGKGVEAGSIMWSELGESCREKSAYDAEQAECGERVKNLLLFFRIFGDL